MMDSGKFVISLDFELLWGIFDKVNPSDKVTYFENTRTTIPEILKLFENNGTHATWAIVGMLLNKNWNDWEGNIPEILPNYEEAKLSAYKFGKENKEYINSSLCFASSLVDRIKEIPGQEIGTHTYSHYYCLEKGQNLNSFKADLSKAIELAKNKNIQIKSLVFPRNQFNSEYLKVCSELGITSVRSNPDNWYWKDTQKDTLQQKIFRTGDAYIGINDKSYGLSGIDSTAFPVLQPASRLLRPYTGNFSDKLKMMRIKTEMSYAARKNEVYHLWWHPHNFGNHPEQNLAMLAEILNHFQGLEKKFGMKSCNMEEITNLVKNSDE